MGVFLMFFYSISDVFEDFSILTENQWLKPKKSLRFSTSFDTTGADLHLDHPGCRVWGNSQSISWILLHHFCLGLCRNFQQVNNSLRLGQAGQAAKQATKLWNHFLRISLVFYVTHGSKSYLKCLMKHKRKIAKIAKLP